MRIFCVVLALALLAGLGDRGHADDAPSPEALQAAQELFTIVSGDNLKQLVSRVAAAFWPAVEQRIREQKVDDATVAELHQEFDRLELAFVTDALKEGPAIYARHFTVAELKELATFYQTPVGAKALREMPQLMGEFTATLVPRLQGLQRQVSDAFDKILRERGYAK